MSTGNRPRRTSTENEGEIKSDNKANDDKTTLVNRVEAKDLQSNNITSKNIYGSSEFIENIYEIGFQLDIKSPQGFLLKLLRKKTKIFFYIYRY